MGARIASWRAGKRKEARPGGAAEASAGDFVLTSGSVGTSAGGSGEISPVAGSVAYSSWRALVPAKQRARPAVTERPSIAPVSCVI